MEPGHGKLWNRMNCVAPWWLSVWLQFWNGTYVNDDNMQHWGQSANPSLLAKCHVDSSSKVAWDISPYVWDSTYPKRRCPRREHTPDESLSLNYPDSCSQGIFSCMDADSCLAAAFCDCFQNIILTYGSTAQMRTDARADFMQRLILLSNLAHFLTTAFFRNCKTYFKYLF